MRKWSRLLFFQFSFRFWFIIFVRLNLYLAEFNSVWQSWLQQWLDGKDSTLSRAMYREVFNFFELCYLNVDELKILLVVKPVISFSPQLKWILSGTFSRLLKVHVPQIQISPFNFHRRKKQLWCKMDMWANKLLLRGKWTLGDWANIEVFRYVGMNFYTGYMDWGNTLQN